MPIRPENRRYDRLQHTQTAYRTRRHGRAAGDLFE